MSTFSRRTFLKGISAAACLSLTRSAAATTQPTTAGATAKRPAAKRLVIFKLPGGIDTIWTADPRRRNEVDADIDIPYAAADIVSAGNLQLGPHLAPLAKFADQTIIMKGIGTRSVQHPYGERVINAMKTNVAFRASLLRRPHFVSVVAQAAGHGRYLDAGYFSPQFLQMLSDKTAQGRLHDSLRASVKTISNPVAASKFNDALLLLERIVAAPPLQGLTPELQWSPLFDATAWALEHDVARCISVDVRDGENPFPWDTHSNNNARQSKQSAIMVPLLAAFLQKLKDRNLLDDTLVMVVSELGRFPVLNDGLGKDHFPEVPILFFGGGLSFARGGVAFGQTDRRMNALPISYSTGKPTGDRLATIDDVATTILHAFGEATPTVYGYVGRPLEFLLS